MQDVDAKVQLLDDKIITEIELSLKLYD